jgi:hypothetical protein
MSASCSGISLRVAANGAARTVRLSAPAAGARGAGAALRLPKAPVRRLVAVRSAGGRNAEQTGGHRERLCGVGN